MPDGPQDAVMHRQIGLLLELQHLAQTLRDGGRSVQAGAGVGRPRHELPVPQRRLKPEDIGVHMRVPPLHPRPGDSCS